MLLVILLCLVHKAVHSNLVNMTLVYTTPSIYITTHFCAIKLSSSKLPLLYDYDTR